MSLDSHAVLRKFLDGKEGIVSGGHGIISTAGATQHAARMHRVPVWALDDSKIKDILLRAFPRLHTDQRQRESAALWVRIIHLYWRLGMTQTQVAYEVGKTDKQVENYVRSISRVADGKYANPSNTNERGLRKRGRPKIVRV